MDMYNIRPELVREVIDQLDLWNVDRRVSNASSAVSEAKQAFDRARQRLDESKNSLAKVVVQVKKDHLSSLVKTYRGLGLIRVVVEAEMVLELIVKVTKARLWTVPLLSGFFPNVTFIYNRSDGSLFGKVPGSSNRYIYLDDLSWINESYDDKGILIKEVE